MTLLSIILLSLAIIAYAISQLAQHGKLKWQKDDDSFWGENSHYRKYTNPLDAPKDNWYYRVFKIGYKERYPLSATLLVFLTDGYHLSQFMFFNLLSLSITVSIGFTWVLLLIIWIGIHLTHYFIYKFLSK